VNDAWRDVKEAQSKLSGWGNMRVRGMNKIALWLYISGSICFLAGSLINLFKN